MMVRMALMDSLAFLDLLGVLEVMVLTAPLVQQVQRGLQDP